MAVTGMKSILHMAAFFNFAVQLLEMHRITHTNTLTCTRKPTHTHTLKETNALTN